MVKKIKKIKKTTIEKVSFLSLCSRSVGIYDFRVDTFWYTFYFWYTLMCTIKFRFTCVKRVFKNKNL